MPITKADREEAATQLQREVGNIVQDLTGDGRKESFAHEELNRWCHDVAHEANPRELAMFVIANKTENPAYDGVVYTAWGFVCLVEVILKLHVEKALQSSYHLVGDMWHKQTAPADHPE